MPLPKGYTLDNPVRLPAGYTLDAPSQAQSAPEPEKPWYEKTWEAVKSGATTDKIPWSPLYLGAEMGHRFGNKAQAIADEQVKQGNPVRAAIMESVADANKTVGDFLGFANSPVGMATTAAPAVGTIGRVAAGAAGIGMSVPQIGSQRKGEATPDYVRRNLIGASGLTGSVAAVGENVPKYVRKGGQAVGERLAETAMGIQTRDRLHGRTPGRTALKETTANQPAELAVEAQQRAAELTKELETAASKSKNIASVDEAVAMLDEEAARAVKENNPELLKQVNQLRNRMTMDLNGQPFPRWTSPDHVLALKRGVDDLIASWGPREQSAPIEAVRHKLYGVLDRELERTVPEAKTLNPRIADLVTVAKRTELKAAGPDTMQKMINRVGVHTGAMTTAGVGFLAGGLPGAVAGFVLPELAVNPRVQMKVARFLAGDQSVKFTPKEIGGLPPKVAMQVINGGKKPPSGGGGGGGKAIPVSEALKDLHATYGVTESHLKGVVEGAGLKYNGIMDTSISRNGLQVFVTDPKTGSTHTIRVDALLNPESLTKAIEQKRYEFSHPQIQPGLPFRDDVLYHGARAESVPGIESSGVLQGSIWLTKDPKYAQFYAGKDGRVYEVPKSAIGEEILDAAKEGGTEYNIGSHMKMRVPIRRKSSR